MYANSLIDLKEMSVLIARIAGLNRANIVEPSIASSCDLLGQDGNESDDDEFSKEEKEKPTNEGDIIKLKMSISTNSINCGDDFTPAENGVNDDAISLDNDGQFDGKNSEQSITDQQQLKEFHEKFAKMEMELKMAKLELENVKKVAKLELENKEQKLKLQEMMVEQKALKEKVTKIEQEKEKNANAADQLSKIQNDQKIFLVKITELEKQQKEQSKANSDQLSKMQNDQKIILEKISEFEKRKQRKALLNFRQNYWDANVCHENLQIIGHKNLIVHYKGNINGWCSVFAKHPILLNNNPSDIFYYEISVKNLKLWMSFGFAVKQQNKLDGTIRSRKGIYVFNSYGEILINGKGKGSNTQYSYGVCDTVGIGFNFATRQLIFTKNGLRLDSADFLIVSSFADVSFYPFVSLHETGDKIEADFGPNFKFNLATL